MVIYKNFLSHLAAKPKISRIVLQLRLSWPWHTFRAQGLLSNQLPSRISSQLLIQGDFVEIGADYLQVCRLQQAQLLINVVHLNFLLTV